MRQLGGWKVSAGDVAGAPLLLTGFCQHPPVLKLPSPTNMDRLTEVYGQLEAAKDRLYLVAQDIEQAQAAVQGASSAEGAAEAAEDVRRQAAAAAEDVARLLRTEGPAASIAEASAHHCGCKWAGWVAG